MSVVVILSDEKDHGRAQETLKSVRTTGKWRGALVWIAIGFDPSPEFVNRWDVQVIKRDAYPMQWLWELRRKFPFQNSDGRESSKLIQFSKWRVFDMEFRRYKSLLYLDSGTYIGHPIAPIFSVDHDGLFVAQDDRYPFDNPNKNFGGQWDNTSMPEKHAELEDYCNKLEPDWLQKGGYFLNCMWLMDTSLIQPDTQQVLLGLLRRFPIAKTNEMAIMNLHFYKVWKPMPEKLGDLRIFDWTERPGRRTEEYMLLKYPHFPK